MLALVIAAASMLSVQGPDEPAWARDGVDPSRPTAAVIKGTVELNPQDAFEAAEDRVQKQVAERFAACAEDVAEDRVPAWLPGFATADITARWLRRTLRAIEPQLVERHDQIRDHGFGKSFQTWLLVESPRAPSEGAVKLLRHRLDAAVERFWVKCGATGAFWGLLALALWWLDRLSRGYMTGRLTALAGLAGIVVPAAAFVLIR